MSSAADAVHTPKPRVGSAGALMLPRESPTLIETPRGGFTYAGLVAPQCRGAGGFSFFIEAIGFPDRVAPGRGQVQFLPASAISLRSKLAGNPAQDCTYRLKGLALRHAQHDGGIDERTVGKGCRKFGEG